MRLHQMRFCRSSQLRLLFSLWRTLLALYLGAVMGIFVQATPVAAAEQLVITYGPLNATVAIEDLETLVNTGEAPGSLKFYLNLAGLDPSVLRNVLAMQLGASSNFMQEMLDSQSGGQLLAQMSEVIYLPPDRPAIQMLKSASQSYSEPTETENIEALRTALIASADDQQVTVLEVLQYYPSQKVYVNVVKLMRFAKSFQAESSQRTLEKKDMNNAFSYAVAADAVR